MPSTPSSLQRSQEKLQREHNISRVMPKEGRKENVPWKVMGQRYMLRGLGDKAGRMRVPQERYVSSLVSSHDLPGHETETSDLSKYKDHSCLFMLLKTCVWCELGPKSVIPDRKIKVWRDEYYYSHNYYHSGYSIVIANVGI